MKIAIVGTRNLTINDISKYLPTECTEIVSGGAKGIDKCATDFAVKKGLKLVEFLPRYEKYGRGAPIIRNRQIVDYADKVIAFWDGKSKGTLSVIKYCQKINKPYKVIVFEEC